MKTSSSIVRDGVSCRYLFQTWTRISCGDERGDSVLCVGGLTATAGGEEIDPEAVRAAGGGLAAATGVDVFVAAECEVGFFAMI